MANDLRDFVEEIKDKVDIVEIIEENSTMKFDRGKRGGRYLHATKPDSFAVDEDWGVYTYFAHAGTDGHQYETGDIFHFLERYAGMDFGQACEYLSRKTGVRIPERKQTNPEAAKRQRDRLEIYEIATAWFERELWKTPAAIDYCKRRGLSEETIRRARLGFANRENMHDLRGDFAMHSVNTDDPAAVAILGKRGEIALWAEQYQIDAASGWVENGYVPSLGYGLRIIFPHLWRGRITYFSARELDWRDGSLVSRPDRDADGNRQAKSYNLPVRLAGERQRYYTFSFTRGAKIGLVVEGQFDALSAAQLGVASVALAGVAPDEKMAAMMKKQKIERIVLGLDQDDAGEKNRIAAAAIFGPMTRLVQWQSPKNDVEEEETQDTTGNNEENDGSNNEEQN